MYVVHACWLDASASPGGLAVWAEDSAGSRSAPRRPGRPPRLRPHPHAASTDELLGLLPVAATSAGAAAASVTLTLPTSAIGELRAGAWQIPALIFDADAALPLLRAPQEGVTWGTSLTHLTHLAAFAADLVARVQLPAPGAGLGGETLAEQLLQAYRRFAPDRT